MGFKRKRDVDVSPFSTESFTASTPEAQSPTPLPDGQSAMDVDSFPRVKSQEAWNDRGLGGELGSRTRKRFRDGRPDEDVVQSMHTAVSSSGLRRILTEVYREDTPHTFRGSACPAHGRRSAPSRSQTTSRDRLPKRDVQDPHATKATKVNITLFLEHFRATSSIVCSEVPRPREPAALHEREDHECTAMR